jgi:hypothetical protein
VTTGRSLFSLLPPAFATVPQYLIHIAVDLLSLTEPDKRLSHTSGSSVHHSVRLRFPYPCQIRSHRFSTLCIVSVFLLSRSIHRGDLRSAGVGRLFAMPLRLTGPHHSRRGHLLPSFYIGLDTRVLPLRLIPQELLVRRSPGYLPTVVQLDAVLDPGGSASRSSLSRSPLGLRLNGKDRHAPNLLGSRGYVSDSGLHPSPRCSRLSSFPAYAFSHYATGRLTNLTQEGLYA